MRPRDGHLEAAGGTRVPPEAAVPAQLRAALTPTPSEITRLRAIALGEVEADFALRGGIVLVVQTGELLRRDVLIAGRFIAAVTRPGALEARRSLDVAGRFVLPAYVDARISVERTLLPPGELARLVVPRGTVTVLTDPAQLEQVYGPRGRALVLDTDTPVRVLPRGAIDLPGVDLSDPWPGWDVGPESRTMSQAVPRQPGPGAAFPPDSYLPASHLPMTQLSASHLLGVAPGFEVPPPPPGGAFAFTHLDDQVRDLIRAGGFVAAVVRDATLAPARAFGLDRVLGSIAPARLADLQIVRDLTAAAPPDVVIAGGRIAAERGRALFDNLDTPPPWAQSSVRLPVGLYTGSFTSPCMHWGGRRDTRLTIVDVRQPEDSSMPATGSKSSTLPPPPAAPPEALVPPPPVVSSVPTAPQTPGTPDVSSVPEVLGPPGGLAAAPADLPDAGPDGPRVSVIRLEPTLRDGVVVADPSRDLLKAAVLDRSGRADRVRVGMVRGIGLARGAIGASCAAAPGDMVIVGVGDADMLTAARALEGMGGGFVVVERGWVLAACPLPLAGLMSDAPWEAVLGQLAAVDTQARDLGCRLAAPLRTVSQLGRELYIRP